MKQFNRLMIAATFVLFSACAKENGSNSNPPNPKISDNQFYKDSLPQILTDDVSSNLGVTVQIANPKDFLNESKYNRMLNLLNKNASTIRDYLQGTTKILLSNSNDINGEIGNYTVSLDVDLDETNLIKFFRTGYTEFKEARIINRELTNKLGIRVKDNLGITLLNLAEVSDRLTIISRQVEFKQDPDFQTLVLDNNFTINSDGSTIDIKAPVSDIVAHLKEAIAARNQWRIELKPIFAELGLSVRFQPGTFTANELLQVIANFKQNAVIIKSTVTQFTQLVLGKRWDFDYNSKTLLLDYTTTGEVLRSKLLELNPIPDNVEFTQILQDLKSSFEKKGAQITEIIIDLPRTKASILKLQKFQSDVIAQLNIADFNKLQIATLKLQENAASDIILVYGTHTLFLNLPSSSQTIEAYLAKSILTNDFNSERFKLEDLTIKLNLTLVLELTDLTTINIERIKSLNQWLDSGELNAAKITALNVKSLRVGDYTIETLPTQIKDSVLIINFEDFRADQMKNILKKKEEPPKKEVPVK